MIYDMVYYFFNFFLSSIGRLPLYSESLEFEENSDTSCRAFSSAYTAVFTYLLVLLNGSDSLIFYLLR